VCAQKDKDRSGLKIGEEGLIKRKLPSPWYP